MSSSTAGSHTKRKHVTTACVPCRRSKTKCNGVSPTCNSCESRDRECRYAVDDDKRKLSLRVGVKLLAHRVDQLYQFIRDNSLEPPEMAAEDETILSNVLNQLFLSHPETGKKSTPSAPPLNAKAASPAAPQAAMTVATPQSPDLLPTLDRVDGVGVRPSQQATPTATLDLSSALNVLQPVADRLPNQRQPDMTLLTQVSCSGPLLDPPAFSVPRAASFPSPESIVGQLGDIFTSLYEPDKDTSDIENTKIMVDQFVDRFGSLTMKPGPKIHHHGATSSLNLVHIPDLEYITIDRNVRDDGENHLDSRGVGKRVPFELVQHLVNLYFTWQNPNLYIVDRSTFDEARVCWCNMETDTPYYSEALLNSICASGAAFETRYHSTFNTSPRSLSEFFVERAKILLEIELDHPSPATVQALVILAGHELGCNRQTRGWLYSGMAVRLSYELALHVDLSSDVTKGCIAQREADIRRDIFWSAFDADWMRSISVGYAPHSNLDDVTPSRPSELSTSQPAGHWIPYASKSDAASMAPLPDCQYEVHCQRTKLCEIVAPMNHTLYGRHRVPLSSFPDIKGAYAQELLHWQSCLPPALQVDLDDPETAFLPHVILLHVQYHHNVVLVHRPWMSRTNTQPLLSQYPSSEFARMKCVTPAIAIAKLLRTYEVHYAIRQLNADVVGMTCSAASILLFAMLANYFCEDPGRHLNTCMRVLDELSAAVESSRRAHGYLMLLQRKWQAQQHSTFANTNSRPSKRIRMAFDQATPEKVYVQ